MPKLVILDEPLNGLDFESVKKVLSILERMAAKGCGFLMISHNEEIFESYVDGDCVYHLREERGPGLRCASSV
jgi:ABC-type multidrug transport system ATPase subunit